jgi:hypothetical protein
VENAYKILIRKAEGKRQLRRPRGRWKDNIKIHFREVVWEGVDSMHLTGDRDQWQAFVNMAMNLQVT